MRSEECKPVSIRSLFWARKHWRRYRSVPEAGWTQGRLVPCCFHPLKSIGWNVTRVQLTQGDGFVLCLDPLLESHLDLAQQKVFAVQRCR